MTAETPTQTAQDFAKAQYKKSVLARFTRKRLSPPAISAIEGSTSTFLSMAQFILVATEPGREQAAALTALEEAKFWTNQSIALNDRPEAVAE